MKYLYKRTKSIEKVLQDEGFTIVTIWEHDFDRNKEMRATAIDEYDLVETPKIRDCFYGGRCEPVKLIYDFQKNSTKGRYIDVVSLYPTVMYYDRYPVGYPKRIVLKPQTYDHN